LEDKETRLQHEHDVSMEAIELYLSLFDLFNIDFEVARNGFPSKTSILSFEQVFFDCLADKEAMLC
jgi:hypothetical protein